MEGSWNDEEVVRFSGEEVRMLLDVREFVNENEDLNHDDYRDWEEGSYTPLAVRRQLGHWENVIEAVGGNIKNGNCGKEFEKEEIKNVVETFAENPLKYEFDGKKQFSPEGEAVPYSHIKSINPELDIPEWVDGIYAYFQKNYTDLINSLGFENPKCAREYGKGSDYDWDKVKEDLRKDIEEPRTWRLNTYDNGEIPPLEYFDKKEKYPGSSQMIDVLGKKEEWKEEVGIAKKGADTVNVDLKDLNL